MIPLFKSQYSICRSILVADKPEDCIENGPTSILKIALDNGLKDIYVVDDSFSGFIEIHKNCKDLGLNLIFGLRLNFCQDSAVKDATSLEHNCKYVIMARNEAGYKRLIKIWSNAASDECFYYTSRFDFGRLKKFWSDEDLILCIPFYDSFLFMNAMTFSNCVPDFSFTKPVFFMENNGLPFDNLVAAKVRTYAESEKCDILDVKSVFYHKDEDFKSYLTFRCIDNRTTLDKPNLDHMSSCSFSFESYLRESKLQNG